MVTGADKSIRVRKHRLSFRSFSCLTERSMQVTGNNKTSATSKYILTFKNEILGKTVVENTSVDTQLHVEDTQRGSICKTRLLLNRNTLLRKMESQRSAERKVICSNMYRFLFTCFVRVDTFLSSNSAATIGKHYHCL
jgi:hypothetical protein